MNASSAIRHEAILASAGSGKTHALVTRYLQLVASGQPPDRIVALTFTRKAAGEFFDRILQRLAGAAVDAAQRADLAAHLARPAVTAPEVVSWMREVIDRMPFLTLGTLDSFFIRIVSAFPLEFGLSGPFRLLEGADIESEREALCRRVFQGVPPDRHHEQQDFLQAFGLATFGLEEKSLHRAFDRFIEDHHFAWLLDPRPEKWGQATAIWSEPPWYLEYAQAPVENLVESLVEALAASTATPRQQAKMIECAHVMAAHVAGGARAKEFKYIGTNILPALPGLRAGRAEMKIFSPLVLEGPACGALAALIGRFLAGEAVTVLQRTHGLARVLGDFERRYDTLVRREGRLTFDDVKWLLARGGPPATGENLQRLAVDVRLDARFDHWLIDEFQDTSLLQWEVLRPLVEEALEDPEGARTYFQVGDEKQSIYRWRGGEPELGRHLIDHYRLPTRPLTASWRSAPPVIEMVNAVFGCGEALATVVPPETHERWTAGWIEHTTKQTDRPGFAALLRPAEVANPADGGDTGAGEATDLELEMAVVVALLREVRPLDRGLSVGLLFRSNKDVAAAVDFLRRQDGLPPVLSETDAAVTVDNPVTLALISLLRAAAHPGDTMAWGYVEMSPLPSVWPTAATGRGHQVRDVLASLWSDGFEAWVRSWITRLEPVLAPDDYFSRARLAHLAEVARGFDARGSRDIDGFLRVAEAATARESTAPHAIQVMTIHKSKGLDFDVVFLPRLAGKSLTDDSRQLLLQSRDDDFHTRWLLRRPIPELVQADPVLAEAQEKNQAAHAYEGLCVLYVAMTRARHALYLIGASGTGDGKAHHGAAFIERALAAGGPSAEPLIADGTAWACGWQAGDPRWFDGKPLLPSPAAAASTIERSPPFVPATPGSRRRPRQTPSGKESHVLTAAQVFSPGASPARDLGVLVHALFERVSDPADPSAAEAWWQSECPDPADWQREAWRQVVHCLADPGVAGRLQVPAGARLWREKRFEIILNDEWVTGTFDRVVVAPHSACIIDFKTDDVTDVTTASDHARGYRPQLELYRQVLSHLTGLSPSVIRTELVFTRLCEVVAVE